MFTVVWDVTPGIFIDKAFGYHVPEVRNPCIKRRKNLKSVTHLFCERFHKISKIDYCLRRICLSVRPICTTRLSPDGFS
jgi:hypothetical protein